MIIPFSFSAYLRRCLLWPTIQSGLVSLPGNSWMKSLRGMPARSMTRRIRRRSMSRISSAATFSCASIRSMVFCGKEKAAMYSLISPWSFWFFLSSRLLPLLSAVISFLWMAASSCSFSLASSRASWLFGASSSGAALSSSSSSSPALMRVSLSSSSLLSSRVSSPLLA